MAVELATAYISIVPETSKIAPGVSKAMGGVEAGAEKRGRSMGGKLMGGLATATKAAAIGAGAAAAAGFGTALVKGFGRLKAIEQAEAKLTGLGHSAESVDKIMGNALASVKGTSFGLGDAASAAASAVASGVKPGEELERTLKLMGDAATIAGTDFGDMASIFNKVSAGGVIQGEELAQLGDRGIPILQLLADELGVSALEVKKLAAEGKVDFATFQDAIESGMGGAALESGNTFQGALANVGAAAGRLGANLLSGVFPKIAPMLQNVIGWLDDLGPVSERAGQMLGAGLSWAGEQAGRFFGEFRNGEGVGSRFRDVLTAIRDAVVVAFGFVRDVAIPAVQGFIEQFRNGEGAGGKFRDILTAIFDAGKAVFGWLRDEGVPALQALGDFILNTLWPDIKAAFIDRIWPAMVEVGRVIKNFWEKDAQPALKGLWAFIRDVLAPFLVDFYENGIKPTFKLIGDAIVFAWENVIKPTFRALKDGGDGLKRNFTTVKDWITDAWTVISTSITAGWDTIKGIFDRFKQGLSDLRDRFRSARDGIRDVWRGLTNAIARPINAVIDKVNDFLSNLKAGLNQIPGVNLTGNWSIRKIILDTSNATVGGGSRQALASGGRVAGYSPHDRADNIPAMLTAGEYVLPVGATRSLAQRFGPGFLEALRQGLPGFATGGIVGGGRTGGFLASGYEWLADLVADTSGWVRRKFEDLLAGIGTSWPAQAARGAAMSGIDGLATWVKDNLFGGGGSAGGRANYGGPYGWAPQGLPWQAIWALIKLAAPEAVMTSNYRPGAITASGVPSLHGQGRAVDLVSANMSETFMKIRGLLKWSQLFFTPMGNLQVGYRDAIVARTHRDHIHAALADGGLVKSAAVFDRGGTLAPGLNLVNNMTGGPEPLRNADLPVRLDDYTIDRIAAAVSVTLEVDSREIARANARGAASLNGRLLTGARG